MTQLEVVDDLADEELVAPLAPEAIVPALRRRTRRPVRIRPRQHEPRKNVYPDVGRFVEEFWAPLYAHDAAAIDASFRWCPQWWAHAEAIARLEACWRAWEVLRLDPGIGPSVWLRDHADPCHAALTDPEGPFRHCGTTHKSPPPLPCATPPVGLF